MLIKKTNGQLALYCPILNSLQYLFPVNQAWLHLISMTSTIQQINWKEQDNRFAFYQYPEVTMWKLRIRLNIPPFIQEWLQSALSITTSNWCHFTLWCICWCLQSFITAQYFNEMTIWSRIWLWSFPGREEVDN